MWPNREPDLPVVRPVEQPVVRWTPEIHASDHEIALEIALDADLATLAGEIVEGHRWRSGWQLERVRECGRWELTDGGPPIAVADARRAPVRVLLRGLRRAILATLDGEQEVVPISVDGADRARAAPWWELDLGRVVHVARLRIDLGPRALRRGDPVRAARLTPIAASRSRLKNLTSR